MSTQKRLEELRTILRSESMSYDELHELQDLGERGLIDPGDVELLEAAGVPERTPHIRTGLASAVEAKDKGLPFPSSHIDVDGVRMVNYVERDDAAELVKRWNAYPDLVAALENLLAYEDDAPPEGSRGAEVYAQARAVLANLNT